MPSDHSYADLLDLNAWIRKLSDSFYLTCSTRTVQESKLYPVNPYIALSYLQAYYRYPTLLRRLEEQMSAEELGDRCRLISHKTNIINACIMSDFYLSGRQILIDTGMVKPTDALDDLVYVLDFVKRLHLSLHRNHAHINPSDAGMRAQLLPDAGVERFESEAIGCKPGDRLHTAVRQYLAQASQYSFLSHCECRIGINNSGPYRISENSEMLVRDFVDMAEYDFPWLDGVSGDVKYNNITLPVILEDTHFGILDDWGSFEASPAYDHDKMIAVGCYTSDFLSDGYISVAMDSPDSLAEFLENEREVLHKATNDLWQLMAGWSRDQMVEAGALVYSSVCKDLFHIAGIYKQDDWFTFEDRASRFKVLLNDEYGRDLISELLGFVSLSSQQESPYTMARHSDGRSHIFSQIPYSVLVDDEFTQTSGGIRSGSTLLPAKTAGWTTTRGKLTLEEANAAAREFSPQAMETPYRFLDDQWVNRHSDDPRAAELEQIHGSGAGKALAGLPPSRMGNR